MNLQVSDLKDGFMLFAAAVAAGFLLVLVDVYLLQPAETKTGVRATAA